MSRRNRKRPTVQIAEPQPLGGWLWLVALGLVVAALRLGYILVADQLALFFDGSWQALTTPGGPAYDAAWAPLLAGQMAANALLLALVVAQGWLFVRRSRWLRWLVLGSMALWCVLAIADFFLADLIAVAASQADAEATRALMRAFVVTAVAAPYFVYSKRVKATFVR